jgi:hypothetical protein
MRARDGRLSVASCNRSPRPRLSYCPTVGAHWSGGKPLTELCCRGKTVRARLNGYEETPLSLSTNGIGDFSASIDDAAQTITYSLSYFHLEGTTTTAAHIHLGQRRTTGGVSASSLDRPARVLLQGNLMSLFVQYAVATPTLTSIRTCTPVARFEDRSGAMTTMMNDH